MMRIDYDQDHDTVYIRLHETPGTTESDEIEPGVIVDYGPDGQVVGFELLDAQHRGPWAAWCTVDGCAAVEGGPHVKEDAADGSG